MARIIGTAGSAPKARKVVVKKAAPKVVRKPTHAPVTDVQSSGGDYGTKKANAYKRTPAGRAPVVVARTETVRDITTGKSHTVTVKYRPLAHPHNQGLDVEKFMARGIDNLYGQHGGGGGVHGGGGAMIGPVGGGVPAEVVKANVTEAAKHPGATAKGLANQVIGTVGGVGQIVLPALGGHPGKSLQAIGRLPAQIAKDYSTRYGPLLKGDVKKYEAGVHKTGAAPGLVDIATAATVAGGVARPAVRALIKSSPKGEEFLTAARPKLRTSGGKAVTQTLSHKPTRVAMQRAQDRLRKDVAEGGVRVPGTNVRIPARRADENGRVGGLQPQKSAVTKSIERHNAKAVRRGQRPVRLPKRPDEVVPLSVKSKSLGAGRAQRISVSRESARAYIANKHEQGHEIGHGIHRAVAGLSPKQRHAVFHVTQGLLPIHGTVEDITKALKAREKQLVDAGGTGGPKVTRGQTELAQVRFLQKHAQEVFSDGKLAEFHAGEVARGKRVAAGDPALRAPTQEARRHRPQGEMLGIKYEPDRALAQHLEDAKAAHDAATREVNAAIRSHKSQIAKSSEKVGVAKTLVRQADARALRTDKGYVKAATDLSAAQKEYAAAKTAHGNAHRNWEMWTTAERHAIEQRAATAEQKLAVAKTNFTLAKQAAVKKLGTAVDKRPVRSLSALESERGKLVEAQQRIATAKASEREAAKAHRQARAAAQRGEINRDAYNTAYVARVKKAAAAKNLPEPTYFKHEKRPLSRLSNRTAGNLSKAVAGPKRSDMRLFNAGQAITTPQAYVRGVADTIKRKHQWPAVANVVADHATSWSRGHDGQGMTIEKLRDAIDHQGLRHEDFTFVKPGMVRKAGEGLSTEATHDGSLHDALTDSVVTGSRADTLAKSSDPAHTQLLKTGGYYAVPKHAADELLANTKPAGKAMRLVARSQGLQSAAILGLNPSWLGMQFAANTLQSGVGMHGNLLDLAKGEPWYRSLSPEERKTVDRSLGVGLYEGTTTAAQLGAHQGKVAAAGEHLGQIPIVRAGGKTVRITDLNPMKGMFRVDGAQNDFFRKAVFANAVKRQAFKDMTDHIGLAQRAVAQVADLLRLKPGETAADQMKRVLADPAKVEEATRYVNDVLGDYLRYTHRERTFKNFAMFYGFLRYATKTLLYTLPVKHPLAAELALKLGQLHDEEVQRIFGTTNIPPWVYARSFQYDSHGKVVRKPLIGKDGKVLKVNGVPMMLPQSIDLGRINPLTGPVTDVVTGGPQALFGMASPLVQAAFNVLIAKKNIGQDRPLTVGGSAAEAKNPTALQDARMILNEGVVQPTFPGRLLMPKGAQTDDALPFLPEPTKYKTVAAQEKALAKQTAAQESGGLAAQLLPLGFAKPDTTGIYIATHGGGPAGKLDAQIKQAKALEKEMVKQGKAVDQYGYATKPYDALQSKIVDLEKQRVKVLDRPASTRVKIKKRPLSTREQIQQSVQAIRTSDPRKEITDEIRRLREQAKVNSGS